MKRSEARDVIYTYSTEQFSVALAAAGVPAEAPRAVRYQGVAANEPPQGSYWARVSMQTVSEEQETLRTGEQGRRFVTIGLVMVQLFVPRSSGKELVEMDELAEAFRNAFRDLDAPDGLEFTGAKIDDNVRVETSWLNVLVTARFSYRQFM
jgi:hypothetical protein